MKITVRGRLYTKVLVPGTVVTFRNLLEENGEDICSGRLLHNGLVACNCGCHGVFEPEDIQILKKGE